MFLTENEAGRQKGAGPARGAEALLDCSALPDGFLSANILYDFLSMFLETLDKFRVWFVSQQFRNDIRTESIFHRSELCFSAFNFFPQICVQFIGVKVEIIQIRGFPEFLIRSCKVTLS